MKRLIFVIAGILLLSSGLVYAQDPDVPDTVIIGSVEVQYNPGEWSYVDVPIYFVTDDSVSDFFLPIIWGSSDSEIYPTDVAWLDIFLEWQEVYDSIYNEEGYIRSLGWYDLGGDLVEPPLYTDLQRVHGMNVTFAISPDAEAQTCTIDTVFISNTFHLYFGLVNGLVSFVPVVIPGEIAYGTVGIDDEIAIAVPSEFAIDQNYPNPFNPETNIEFQLPSDEFVSIEIFNILGQQVKKLVSERMEAGYHQIRWNGTNDSNNIVPSGVYFYRMNAGDFTQTKKMVMLK